MSDLNVYEHFTDEEKINLFNRRKNYKLKFAEMVAEQNLDLAQKLSDVYSTENDLQVGQIVSYTNDAGVVWPDLEILGFDKKPHWDRCVYLNLDCYWFAVEPTKLKVQDKLIFEME